MKRKCAELELDIEDQVPRCTGPKRNRKNRIPASTDQKLGECSTMHIQTNEILSLPLKEKRDPNFFFHNGDLIFRSLDTLFCVHADKFRNIGGFFETLLLLPPAAGEETIGGVPVCPLPDTEPHEIHILISWVYDKSVLIDMTRQGRPVVYWDAILTLLKFSEMYDICKLRMDVIEVLRKLLQFPPVTEHDLPYILGIKQKDAATFLLTFPLEAIYHCHRYDLPVLLPMAYYYAAQLPIATIVKGIIGRSGVRLTLSHDDMVTILEGREKLKIARRTVRFKYLNDFCRDGRSAADPVPGCKTLERLTKREDCFAYILRTSLDFNRSGFMDSRTDLLEYLPRVSEKYFKRHLCEPCSRRLQEELMNGMMKAWDELPKCFGFIGWDEVIKMQASADRLHHLQDFS